MKPRLSLRQREILRLIANGEPDKEIARRLEIGEGTVSTYVCRILARLKARSRANAVFIWFVQ